MDLVVEHWNAVLKQRLAGLGGRYTEESIERIGASLNLASLLESKLYPTYTERLESFLLSFHKQHSNTVVSLLREGQPWALLKLIFGTRWLMGLSWPRFVFVWHCCTVHMVTKNFNTIPRACSTSTLPGEYLEGTRGRML